MTHPLSYYQEALDALAEEVAFLAPVETRLQVFIAKLLLEILRET